MGASPFIIVGLGNPGSEYRLTYHNLGFMVVDILADRWRAPNFTKKFKSQVSQCETASQKILLVKPQTYMNLSGEAVSEIVRFYKTDAAERLVVVSDDLDLPACQLRIRLSGGYGGHNGLKSIIEQLGTKKFPRVRIGIGRSEKMASRGHVLSSISKAQRESFESAVARAADAVETIVTDGVLKSMNIFNQRDKENGT